MQTKMLRAPTTVCPMDIAPCAPCHGAADSSVLRVARLARYRSRDSHEDQAHTITPLRPPMSVYKVLTGTCSDDAPEKGVR